MYITVLHGYLGSRVISNFSFSYVVLNVTQPTMLKCMYIFLMIKLVII